MAQHHASPAAAADPRVAHEVATIMQALAAPSRVRILGCLVAGPLPVGRLVELTGMEQPAVSQQLRVLRQLGIVAGERRGRQVVYTLHDSHVADLLAEAVAHAEHRASGVRTHAHLDTGTAAA
jgi:DNA-binding transcriptional ArsR family regulator